NRETVGHAGPPAWLGGVMPLGRTSCLPQPAMRKELAEGGYEIDNPPPEFRAGGPTMALCAPQLCVGKKRRVRHNAARTAGAKAIVCRRQRVMFVPSTG